MVVEKKEPLVQTATSEKKQQKWFGSSVVQVAHKRNATAVDNAKADTGGKGKLM